MFTASAAPEITTTLEVPSPERISPKVTAQTSLAPPIVELETHTPAAVSNLMKQRVPALVDSQSLRRPVPTSKSDSDLEDGEIVECDPRMTSEVNKSGGDILAVNISSNHITEQTCDTCAEANDLTLAEIESGEGEGQSPIDLPAADTETTAADKAAGSDQAESSSLNTENLPHVTQGATTSPEVKISIKAACDEPADEVNIHDSGEDTLAEEGGGDAIEQNEDTAVETQKHAITVTAPSQSVPPHMRAAFKPPNALQVGTPEARPHWPTPILRTPRGYYPPAGHLPPRPPLHHEELQRTQAQLMKARSDLDTERKVNAELHKTVGAEKQASIVAAMADMLSDLLQKQADALTAKAKTQEKERDLQYREQRIMQLEVYLSCGQKQLKWQLEQQGIQTMRQVDEANLRHEVELKMKHQQANIEGKISIQVERLRLQEAAQKIREHQYKVLIRDALEDEIRAQLAQARPGPEAAEEVHGRGSDNSLASKSDEVQLKQQFLKGYAACYRGLTALHNVRNGKITVDSAEMGFLFDPTHPENPHNIGLEIGRLGAATVTAGSTLRRSEENAVRPEAVTHRGRGQALVSDTTDSLPLSAKQETTRTMQTSDVQQEQTHDSAPRRATFASELRASSSTAAPASRSHAQVSRTAAHSTGVRGEGIYPGRRIMRYDESEDERVGADLIDLY